MTTWEFCFGQKKRSFSRRFCHRQKPLRCQYKILMLVRCRLQTRTGFRQRGPAATGSRPTPPESACLSESPQGKDKDTPLADRLLPTSLRQPADSQKQLLQTCCIQASQLTGKTIGKLDLAMDASGCNRC